MEITEKDLKEARELDETMSLANMSDAMLEIVARIAGIPFKQAKFARDSYAKYNQTESLDEDLDQLTQRVRPIGQHGGDRVIDILGPDDIIDPDLVATPTLEEELEKEDRVKIIRQFLKGLDAREEAVIRARFGFDDGTPKTLEEIGQMYHVTRERIRQIEAKALAKLKKRIEKSIYGDII